MIKWIIMSGLRWMEKEQEPRPSYSKSVYLLSLKRCAGCQLFMHSSPCGLAIPVLHSLVLLPNASKRSLALLGRSAAVLVMSAASPGRACIPGGGNGEKKRQHYKTSAYISLVRSVSMAAPANWKAGKFSLYLLQTLWQRQAKKKWVGIPKFWRLPPSLFPMLARGSSPAHPHTWP